MKVSDPIAIQGLRQIGVSARRRGDATGTTRQARSACANHPGRPSPHAVSIRASSSNAPWGPSRARMSVTWTSTPAARRASASARRFSSTATSTRSGRRATIAGTSGFLVPPTRVTSSPAGWVHQSVAPTRRPGAVAATASVSDGTRLTTRVTLAIPALSATGARPARAQRRKEPPQASHSAAHGPGFRRCVRAWALRGLRRCGRAAPRCARRTRRSCSAPTGLPFPAPGRSRARRPGRPSGPGPRGSPSAAPAGGAAPAR